MRRNAILPTAMNVNQFGSEVNNLIYVFNRWLKMLQNYGKLDPHGLNDDFTAIAKVIKSHSVANDIKRAVQNCRNYAVSPSCAPDVLVRALTSALKMLCDTQEIMAVKEVAQHYADQGMTERYRFLSKRLAKEKIRKLGREVIFTCRHTDDKDTTKLVRRIVEKRAAQTVYRQTGKKHRDSNRFRQSVRRAISFSLYNKDHADYDVRLRMPGTHWKVAYNKHTGEKMMIAKFSYNSYEDAMEAIRRHELYYPNDKCPMTAYICSYCGKWHIGHKRCAHIFQETDEMAIIEAI